MFTSPALLALIGLATASPLSTRQVNPNYPQKTETLGFTLVANVTDPSSDFTTSINYWTVSGVHVGAGQNIASISPDSARIFYQNGTTDEVWYGLSNILADGGTPPFPWGIQKNPTSDEFVNSLTINAGQGDAGFGFTRFPDGYTYLRAASGTFVACNETIPYYGPNRYFVTLKFAVFTFDEEGGHEHIPQGCVPIRLIPEVAELAELPDDALASHEYAQPTYGYEDVSEIDWSQYGP